jgi:hypothetical protein
MRCGGTLYPKNVTNFVLVGQETGDQREKQPASENENDSVHQ